MSQIPSTFKSRDVGQGGVNTYAGNVSTLEQGCVLDLVDGYPDDIILDQFDLGNLGVFAAKSAATQGVSEVNDIDYVAVLHTAAKEWTLDHVDMCFDALAISATTAQNEINTITANATPNTGGTFTLTVNGQTTAAIAFNATAAIVQAALEALSNVEVGDVVCVGSVDINLGQANAVVTITWGGNLANQNITITFDGASLTGGTNPAFATTQAGQTTEYLDVSFYNLPVGSQLADLDSTMLIGAACRFVDADDDAGNSPVHAAFAFQNVEERVRRFDRGDRLVAVLRAGGTALDAALGNTSGMVVGRNRIGG